jgi:quercetin dioxygenase-like cupin family protein
VEIQPKRPSTKGPAQMFTGDVWFDVTAQGEVPSRLRVNLVRFAPGGEVIEIRPGDTGYTPPGEWHWHGAAPDHFMSTWPCGKPR